MDDTSNKQPERILGRQLARELTLEQLDHVSGGLQAAGVSTWTMSNPPDGPYSDSGGGGPILTAAPSETP